MWWKRRPVSEEATPPSEAKKERPHRAADERDRGDRGEGPLPEETSTVKVVDRRWWARNEPENDDAARSAKPTYIEELETQLTQKDTLLTEYAARYTTAAKEFEDTRARLRKEVSKDVEREKRRVLASFLEIIDNLDRAIDTSSAASDSNPSVANLLQGVELVRQQFLLTLNSYGVERIEAGAASFDPNLHDAISVVPVTDAERDSVVIDVVTPGYRLGDEVLRPATVTVGKLVPAPQ